MTLYAGAAKTDITPPPGRPMAGFPHLNAAMPGGPTDREGYFGREGGAEGIHDPLFARALVLENGRQRLGLVAVDLVQVEAPFTAAIRGAVELAIGLPAANLLIAASHTHSGPALFNWVDDQDPELEPQIQQSIVAAVLQAYANRRPARIGWEDTCLESITINRRDSVSAIAPRVGVMRVEDNEEKPIALAVNFAIHGCMLSALNRLYSGDVSGYAMAALERMYPGTIALFLNGAAGNINPVAYPWEPKQNAIPVFRQAWRAGHPHPRTFRGTERLGHILAASAVQAAEQVREYDADPAIAGTIRQVALPLKAAEELTAFREFMQLGVGFGADRMVDQSFVTEVQALSVGPVLYVGLPGEPFLELGQQVERQCGQDRTYVVGYANDDARYVLPQQAYEDNRYETWGSMLARGSGELLVEAATQAAREVRARP